MSIGLRRGLPLVALIGIVVGALLLAVGASSPTEAQQPTAGSSQQLSQLNSERACTAIRRRVRCALSVRPRTTP
jgi:hypothetical protein